jgi:hypothetical protein
MSDLVLYLDVDAAEAAQVQEALRQLGDAPGVASADVRLEESERSLTVADLASITVTLTAVGGAVGATALLLDKVRALVVSIRGLRQALVETPAGPKPLASVRPADLEP